MSSSSLLGCGWLGIPLAQALLGHGVVVRGSTTHSSRLATLTSLGVEPVLLRIEGDDEGAGSTDFAAGPLLDLTPALERFFSSDTFVINIPPETAMGEHYHVSQVTQILSCLRGVRHLVYVSSTSVYGSRQGLVDETTVCLPDTASSGSILLRAEALVRDWARAGGMDVGAAGVGASGGAVGGANGGARSVSIVRPGGLIGPGRHPGLFLAGRRGVANGDSPVNMISQLDLVELVSSILLDHAPPPGQCEIYNAVALGHPTRYDFYSRASISIGVLPPQFAEESPADRAASADAASAGAVAADGTTAASPAGSAYAKDGAPKIVASEKIRRVTGVKTRFDDLYSAIGSSV